MSRFKLFNPITKGSPFVVLALAGVLITACGGGSGDTSGNEPVVKETVALDHLSNAELQRSASAGSKQLQSGMDNAQDFATQPAVTDSVSGSNLAQLQDLLGMSGSTSSSTDESVVFGTGTGDASINSGFEEPGQQQAGSDGGVQISSMWEDAGVAQLIDTSLGLIGNADVVRDGNTMIIDPDDNELCGHDMMDVQDDFNDMQFCLDMAADLTVRIDGQTEDSGNISYLFQEQTVLQIEYAPGNTRFKLRLPGVKTVFERAAQLEPEYYGTVPQVFEGVIELGSRVDNAAPGSEAGAMDITISAPIVIQDDASGTSIQIAAADLLRFEHDNGEGSATVELDSRAFLYSFTDGQVIEFAGSGGSVKIDLLNDGEQISVSKLGFGNGPVTLTVDSVEVMRMTLNTFGFDIDTVAEQLALTGALDFNLALNLYAALFEDDQSGDSLIIEASANAPANALFSAQSNGSVRLDNAGPFMVNWLASFGGQTNSASFVASPGECFSEGSEGNALFSQVVCP